MGEFLKFRVGDKFPPTRRSAALVRLLVATRHVQALTRLQSSGDSPVDLENRRHRFFAVVAAGKEAADAFRMADSEKWFDRLPGNGEKALRDALVFVRNHVSKTDTNSLYSRVFKPVRDTAGGHWKLSHVEDALRDLQETEMRAAEGGSSSFQDAAIPLVEKVLSRVFRNDPAGEDELNDLMDEMARFSARLCSLAETAYGLVLLDESPGP